MGCVAAMADRSMTSRGMMPDGAREGPAAMQEAEDSLPHELADRFTQPFARFLKIEAATGGLLLLATLAALILSNSAWSEPFLAFWETPLGLRVGTLEFSRSFRHWINDGLMTVFFFVVALELKRELILGELKSLRLAMLSMAGAVGGMLVPATIYFAFLNGQIGAHGWGTVIATDTAFVVGCLALLGARVPASLRLFLLSLAIFDDIGAILVVAVGYGETLNWAALAMVTLAIVVALAVSRVGIRSGLVHFNLGLLIWLCFDASGVHPTFTGVVLGLMASTRGWVSDDRLRAIFQRVLTYPRGDHWSGDTIDRRDLKRAGIAATEVLSPVEQLEMTLHPLAGFVIMPLFAFANAGVVISGADFAQPVAVAICVGLVLGKPIGIITFSWLAVRLGIATRAGDLSWPFMAAGGMLCGIGFTMSLFVAGMAYEQSMLGPAKVGILVASAAAAGAGMLTLFWLASAKRAR